MNKENFKYIILDHRHPLTPVGFKYQRELFTFWRGYWNDILRSVGLQEEMDPAEFYDQHKITAILYKGSVVTMHLLSFVHRPQYASSPYLAKFNEELKNHFLHSSINSFLTLQYLTYNSALKSTKEGPFRYLGMVMGTLSTLHKQLENVDAVVSVTRKDLGVSNSLAKMNFQSIDGGQYNNTPVAFQISTDPKMYPHEEVANLVQHFWNNRIEINNPKSHSGEAA